MARTSDTLIEDSKRYISNFYVNDKWLEEPIPILYAGKAVDNSVMVALSKFYSLLLDSSMLNDCTKLYLKSNMKGVKDTIDKYNAEHMEVDWINLNTAQSKVQYDKKKLDKYFEKNILFDLITYPEENIEKFETTVDTLLRVYMNDNEYNRAMVIKLSKDNIVRNISEDNWDTLIQLLGVYSKKRIVKIENDINSSDMVGYYNYLISSKGLNERDTARLGEIREVLGLDDN
jgi:hypothetical protein